MLKRHIARIGCVLGGLLIAGTAWSQDRDDYDHLIEINMASLTMLVEEGLVPRSLASKIAAGTLTIEEEQRAEGARRSSNYLVFEGRLIELAGPEAHSTIRKRGSSDPPARPCPMPDKPAKPPAAAPPKVASARRRVILK